MKEDPIPFLLNTTFFVEINEISSSIIIGFIIVLILIFISSLISGSEVSFFSLNSQNLDKLSKTDTKKEIQIRRLLKKPSKLLATILIANNFVNVAIIVISSYLTSILFNFDESPIFQFIIQVVIITFILVLLGEITPKVYAKQHAVNFSKRIVSLISFLEKIFSPISYLLVSSTSFIDKRLKQKSEDISMNEIQKAIDLTENNLENEDDKRILKSIVEFGNIDVKEIMKPRTDVISIEMNTEYSEVLQIIVNSSYSRIPVYKESFDDIKGILYIKDLLPHLSKENLDWFSLCHSPLFVPETKKINDLLKEFQTKKTHLAIVVDEYGGTSGIVTLEDVLEEIVGEINDEFDDDGKQYSKLDADNFIFEGKTSLNDFLKIVDGETDYFDDEKGDSDSLAGLILERCGVIPKISDRIEFPPYTFIIESADDRRIKRIKVIIKR